MSRRRMDQPPPDHPLPQLWVHGGYTWSPEAGEYVPASLPPAILPPAILPPATTEATNAPE